MNVSQFFQILARSDAMPVYVIVGTEGYLRRQAVERVMDRFVAPAARAFNFSVFSDSLEDIEDAISVCRTLPMVSPSRVVVIRGAELNSRTAGQSILKYLTNPSRRTVLVLELHEFKKESLLPEIAKRHGIQVDCSTPTRTELTNWIQQYVRNAECRISTEAAKLLLQRVGNSLQELASNLDKIFDWLDYPGLIEVRHVQEIVGETREPPLWELTDAILFDDTAKALSCLDSCLRAGEAPLVVLAVVSKVFRNLIVARDMLDDGRSPEDVGQVLRIPEFKLRMYVQIVRQLPPAWAHEMLALAADVDDRMKSTPTPQRLLLEMLLCRAVHKPAQSGRQMRA